MDLGELFKQPATWFLGAAIGASVGLWWARKGAVMWNQTVLLIVATLALSAFFVPGLPRAFLPRIALTLIVVGFGMLIAYHTVWIDLSGVILGARSVHSSSVNAPPPIAGVVWRPAFTELTVDLVNDSKWDYSDLDVTITPDAPVVGAEQNSGLTGVSIWRLVEPPLLAMEHVVNGERRRIDLVPLASEFGVRIRAVVLPARTHIPIRIAVSGMTDFPLPGALPVIRDHGIYDADYVLCLKNPDTDKSAWLGYSNAPDRVFSRAVPRKVQIAGAFNVLEVSKKVDLQIETVDPIGDVLPKILKH